MLQNHARRALSPSNARYHPFKLSRSTATPPSANAPPLASGSAHQWDASFLPAQHTRDPLPPVRSSTHLPALRLQVLRQIRRKIIPITLRVAAENTVQFRVGGFVNLRWPINLNFGQHIHNA